MKNLNIPSNVSHVTKSLQSRGFEAYLVGGCVRDILLGRTPKDWDIATNGKPEQIIDIFEALEDKVVYENNFGTVGIVFEEEDLSSSTREVQVTPYRVESKYSDNRHPDEVKFAETLEEDLSRRDFTINAMAYDFSKGQLVDLYKGQTDLKDKVIRTVGNPNNRFNEDALRMLRAVRFSAELGFEVSYETLESLKTNANLLENISMERIRDEFVKIIMSDNLMSGLELANQVGILQYISPELEEGIDVDQNRSHIYNVWTHNLRAGQTAVNQGWPLHVRLAALFHDVGKPRTKRFDKQQNQTTFYGHEVVGARMVNKFMKRLKFPKRDTDLVTKLVRYHMFFSDTEQITLSAVRRMIRNVGPEHIWDLMNVRRSDRIGMGRPKAAPYRLRKYESMIEEALRDPISVGQLKIDGDYMIATMKMKPGPRMGWILHALLEEVLEDPSKNELEKLQERVVELDKLSDKELKSLGESGKDKKQELEEAEIKKLRRKHNVQ